MKSIEATDFVKIIRYLTVRVDDACSAAIDPFFSDCNRFIHEALESTGENVLVHCHQGASRSATIVCAYLVVRSTCTSNSMACEQTNLLQYAHTVLSQSSLVNRLQWRLGLSADESISYVRQRRFIKPNESFVRQLKAYAAMTPASR
jgi:hypothetical protein